MGKAKCIQYNSLCDFKKAPHVEKGKKNTILVCHAWLRWLVTNLTQLSYWWRKTDAVTCSQRLVWKFPAFIRTQTGLPKLLDLLISLSVKEVYFSSSTLVTSTKGLRSGWIFWMYCLTILIRSDTLLICISIWKSLSAPGEDLKKKNTVINNK